MSSKNIYFDDKKASENITLILSELKNREKKNKSSKKNFSPDTSSERRNADTPFLLNLLKSTLKKYQNKIKRFFIKLKGGLSKWEDFIMEI